MLACDARTVTVPAEVIVTVLPLIVAGPETMLKLTGTPERPPVALTVNGALPKTLFGKTPKLIVWSAFSTLIETVFCTGVL